MICSISGMLIPRPMRFLVRNSINNSALKRTNLSKNPKNQKTKNRLALISLEMVLTEAMRMEDPWRMSRAS